jgi:exopolyphosphatase/guanosine-5'-triphosphate,3'-diphosphate pyrophosphatase
MATRAVIDIGANSTKLLVGRVVDEIVAPVFRARDVSRLSEDFFESRQLRPEAIRRTADAVCRFVSQAQRYDPESIRIVATSAARDALNRAEFTTLVEVSTGIEVQIISGEQEAQWAYDGVLSDPAITHRAANVVFDLGGGSTEFVVGGQGVIHLRRSYSLGAIRLFQSLNPSDPPSETALAGCRSHAREVIGETVVPEVGPALDAVSHAHPAWIGSGGTACALQRILCRGKLDAPTSSFRLPALQMLVDRLWSIPRTKRVAEGVAATRVDSILTGAVIIESLMVSLGIPEIAVSGYGMRHGALLAAPRSAATTLSPVIARDPALV